MPDTPDVDKPRIVDALNQKYATTLPVGVVEVAVTLGFTSWAALAADAEVPPVATVTMLGYPVRFDATLCAPEEVWIEGAKGDAVRVWPEPKEESPDA